MAELTGNPALAAAATSVPVGTSPLPFPLGARMRDVSGKVSG